MKYLDTCDLCGSEDIHVEDYGFCLCYACYLKNPAIQKEMDKRQEKEGFQLGYE